MSAHRHEPVHDGRPQPPGAAPSPAQPRMGDAPEPALLRTLVTPEGVALRLALASGGERLGAFLLDLAAIAAVLAALTLGAVALGVGGGVEVAGVIWLLGFFLLRNFWFAFFELRPRAATPGKRAMGIRVAARNGGRLSADAILARNLVRELELFLPLGILSIEGTSADTWLIVLGLGWAGIFLVFPLLNRDRLRVGDMLAGTWVVRAPRRTLLPDLAAPVAMQRGARTAAPVAFTPAQLAVYGIKELHVLEDVLRQRDPAAVALVAQRIIAKLGWDRAGEADLDFLQAYYAALRGRLERDLLFGRRQADKFDGGPGGRAR